MPNITIDNEILGGEPVFTNTRVPVKILFDYLEGGSTLDAFLTQYPSVRKETVVSVLKDAEIAVT